MRLPDHGPIYTETLLGRFPVEPWNTYSNLIFLATFLYFAITTRFSFKRYPLITVALPILLVGFIGGTLFHATRSLRLWLVMDYLPISILCLLAAFYFWVRLTGSRLVGVVGLVLPFLFVRLLWLFPLLEISHRIAIGYTTLALAIVVPASLCSYTEGWRGARALSLSVMFFLFAIAFRSIDRAVGESLQMGTHFLWHIFGGMAAFSMLAFVKLFEESPRSRLVARS